MSRYGQPIDPDTYPGLKIETASGMHVRIWTEDGEKKRQSLKTKDVDEAKQKYERLWGIKGSKPLQNLEKTCDVLWAEIIAMPGRADSSVDAYKAAFKHAQPIIGKKKPTEVEPETIVAVYNRMLEVGSRRNGKPLSVSSFEKTEAVLSKFFNTCIAVPYRCLDINPVPAAKEELERLLNAHVREQFSENDKIDEASDKVVTEDEVALISSRFVAKRKRADEVLYAQQMVVMVDLLVELGCRIGELLGLRVGDCVYGDLIKSPHIKFRRQRAYKLDPKDPATYGMPLKSARAFAPKRRDVGLSPYAVRVLAAYVDQGIKEGWLKQDGLLFPNYLGAPRRTDSVTKKVGDASVWAGLRRITPHAFRHTYASRQRAMGVEVSDIAINMGDTVEVVTGTYLHDYATEERHARAAAAGRQ